MAFVKVALLAFLTEPWLSSFRDFGEIFGIALDISKALVEFGTKPLSQNSPILLSATFSQVSSPTILLLL